MNTLSVVIPTLDAAGRLARTLTTLGIGLNEVVVVDGGSVDDTRAIAVANEAVVLSAPRGRGTQMAAGVAAAGGEWLLLLHADTRLQPGWEAIARRFMSLDRLHAGYCRFILDSPHPKARILEHLVAWRARWLGLPYGDQGLLISRHLLTVIGGIRPLPLMEDVDLVRRIGRARLVALDIAATTSATRWERDGWLLRSARNLACLALYFAGVPPRWLVRFYG